MENKETLNKIRHSLAHLLAISVLKIDSGVKLAIGPVIDNGFYYDFEFSSGFSLSPESLKDLEKNIRTLIKNNVSFEKKRVTVNEAREIFKDQPYKLELIEELEKNGSSISIYTTGDFIDLCEGDHIKTTTEIDPRAFSLIRIAGAYWRGDEKNKMLTRIYGIAYESKEKLDEYRALQEEAKKRDHRKLGRELDLFTFSDLIGSGLPLFTPRGTAMREAIVDKIRSIQKKFGFEPVWIPHITKKDLYEISGHWDKFGDELFKVKGQGDTEFVMKPMNCPHHTQIYVSKPRSYRDLPIRYTETTTNYRDEQAGELLGLSRVRSLTQDDGHVFCTLEQVFDEARKIVSVIRSFYSSLDMFNKKDYWVSLSIRDPKTPEKYLGEEEMWNKAEEILKEVAEKEKLNYKLVEGEAVFYGPKLDFMFKDALGREWQLATIQLDFVMPERFSLKYTDVDGKKKTPVMIHRAIAGSLERFMAILIEHFAGAFPLWIAPVQIDIMPIGETHRKYALEVCIALRKENFRVLLRDEDETLGKRIRETKLQKTPYFLVIGDNEVKAKTITVEHRDNGKIGEMKLDEFIAKLKNEIGD